MIAQLMALRLLSLNPDVACASTFRQAVKLCASPKATIPQLAGMQAALTTLPIGKAAPDDMASPAQIRDLCQQALHIRRTALAAAQPQVRFNLEARGRLVGAR